MNVWAALKKAFGRKPKDPLPSPPVVTTEFAYPTVASMTVHTRTTLTQEVECSISATPTHEVKILLVDNVVKAICSPCGLTEALTAAQLGGKSCGTLCKEVVDWMRGYPPEPQQYQIQNAPYGFTSHGRGEDPYRATLFKAAVAASEKRVARQQRKATPTSERVPPKVWTDFIKRATGLIAQFVVEPPLVIVYVETPGVGSRYDLIGRDDGWALAQGPGDQRVYELLSKHVKLNSKLVKYL